MDASHVPTRAKRVRLPPQIRAQRILDAALAEFSRHGFAGTRLEDIARRAGLSKSGFYAHYPSKEAIFHALLTNVLRPMPVIGFPAGENKSERINGFVERFIDLTHRRLREPDLVAVLRLLIAESARVPDIIQDWRRQQVQPHRLAQQQVLQDAVTSGLIRPCPLADNFFLAYAPALYGALVAMVFREGGSTEEIDALRQTHTRLMLDQLRAP